MTHPHPSIGLPCPDRRTAARSCITSVGEPPPQSALRPKSPTARPDAPVDASPSRGTGASSLPADAPAPLWRRVLWWPAMFGAILLMSLAVVVVGAAVALMLLAIAP